MSDHTIVIIQVKKNFFVQFCVFLPPLLNILISSASVRSIPFLSFIKPIFAWNVPLVSLIFLKRYSSLSHSVVFLYFFTLIAEEGFLISSCYSSEFYIQMLIFPFLLCFSLLSFFCKTSSDSLFAFLLFFSMGMVLIRVSCTMSRTSFHSSSGTLSDLVP